MATDKEIDFALRAADKTLDAANLAISNANTFLVYGSIILLVLTTLITFAVSYYSNKNKKKEIKRAIEGILCEISKDDAIRNKLVENMLKDDDILKRLVELQEFKEKLDIAVSDQIGILKEYENGAEDPDPLDEANLKDINVKIEENDLEEEKNAAK